MAQITNLVLHSALVFNGLLKLCYTLQLPEELGREEMGKS